jgi:SAM-dependent methyltransferase
MTEVRAQGRFAGVVKIVRFNVQFYVLSAAVLAGVGVLIASEKLGPLVEVMVQSSAAVVAFWTLSSLFVSWYVYDYTGVTRWQWLPSRLPVVPHRWANIHAGLDESTSALRQLLPGTEGSAVDIYDPGEMTEPSIARARQIHPASVPFKRGTYDALPLLENDGDAVFLLFAAHEVRDEEHRMHLLRQAASVMREKGCVVLVEHLRDWKNFIAFGPGFFHFYSRRNWLRNIREAGLVVAQESAVTPFVDCFVLRRKDR